MHPIVKLLPGRHKRLKSGHPWIFSNEVADQGAMRQIEPGSPVSIIGDNGEKYGTAVYNPHSLVAGRLVDVQGDITLDKSFFADRIARAAALRDRLFDEPYYRLIHAEADGLPGLIIDRYGDAVVLQLNIAGMDLHREVIVEALDATVAPRMIVLRNDSPSRLQEGLPLEVATLRGRENDPVIVRENGATFSTNLAQGQKTGWFFDQRRNRAFVASLARGAHLIDFYTYGGGFAVQALRAGALHADLVDRSAAALENAAASATENGVAGQCHFVKEDAFSAMERLIGERAQYDIVISDPPAFVKSKKDLNRGSRAYRKMARLAARLVAPGGVLFVASCSHNVASASFADLVNKGLTDARRTGRILRSAGAGPDHPVHPGLPETAYLKTLTLQLD
jgi:23S rRNA (cytosine1962-C5)-methyltransferase